MVSPFRSEGRHTLQHNEDNFLSLEQRTSLLTAHYKRFGSPKHWSLRLYCTPLSVQLLFEALHAALWEFGSGEPPPQMLTLWLPL